MNQELKMTPRIKAFVIALLLSWMFIIYSVLIIAMPNNAMTPYYLRHKFKVVAFFPQGWGFFTRNPREVRNIILVKSNGEWINDPRVRNGTLHNLFGLRREGRMAMLIYGKMLGQIANKDWNTLKDYEFAKLNLSEMKYKAVPINFAKSPGLDMPQDIIIERREIVPWAYREFENKTGLPVTFVKLHINYQ
ncbi:SdpA family antimicrobial peptide system protein [Mucilaginibacter sp.]|uniref:SdpA family antimicrobial peptide system protein n=1 Tax=Mucilaginibacter sp. TaxID=1882438 RepID=UPI002ED24279